MVRCTLSARKAAGGLTLAGMFMITGCTMNPEKLTPDGSANEAAFRLTASMTLMEPGGEIEHQALQRFRDFYAVYSVEAIRAGVRGLYADNAWFGDPFHVVQGIDDIEHYFIVMAEPVEQCTFTVDSIQRSGDDYYARWTMELESSAAKGKLIRTIGLSHVRFDAEGKIIFQQDYWDTSAMLDRLPVVGYWTRLVKTRLAKGLEK